MNTATKTSDAQNIKSIIDESSSDENEHNLITKLNENQNLNVENNLNTLQFRLKPETTQNGQVTYKVVTINQNDELMSSFTNVNSPSIIQTNNHSDNDTKLSVLSNIEALQAPVYLMMPSSDIVQASHKLITKTSSTGKIFSPTKTVRDERRRANHNEVERRRRDNINKWIVELSKVIPDCSNDHTKHGQSKGGILEKTVQYLIDLKLANHELSEHIKKLEKYKIENEILRQENENIKRENELLKERLEAFNSTLNKKSLI